MRGFCFLVFVLVLAFGSAECHAYYQHPPAKLIDQKVEPSCLKVTKSYAVGAWFGSDERVSAILITNECGKEVFITQAKIAPVDILDRQPVSHVAVAISSVEDGTKKFKRLIFSPQADGCSSVKVNEFLLAKERWAWEYSYKDLERNNLLYGYKKPGITLEDYLKKHLQPAEHDRLSNREIICGELTISVGAALLVTVEYERTYELQGYIGARGTSPVAIRGTMINPKAITAFTEALANKGDNSLRHDLALSGNALKSSDPKLRAKALGWLMTAAENGFVPSQIQLLGSYKTGYGVEKDLENAYFWGLLAANAEGEHRVYADFAKREALEIEKQLTPAQIANVKTRVEEWKKAHPKSEPAAPTPR